MNHKQLLFNTILFNQVPAGEALKGSKQKDAIEKIQALNTLLIKKNLKFPEILAKVNKIKNTLCKGLPTIETESCTGNRLHKKDKNRRKLNDTFELNLNESKYVRFNKCKEKSHNTTLRSDVYINELINSGRSTINRSTIKINNHYPVIKPREFSFDPIKINHINDLYRSKETVKDILEVEKFIVKPFKYK